MEFLKLHYNTIPTILFVMFIVVAHLAAPHHYDFTKNTISDLGAQGYNRKLIMQVAFLLFGLVLATGILYNGCAWRTTPLLVYGVCIALTGIFCTKPFFPVDSFSTAQATMHSVFAQGAGIAFSLGILTQCFFPATNIAWKIHLLFFLLVIALSISFGLLNNYQGIAQRLLYLVSFIWLVKYYKP